MLRSINSSAVVDAALVDIFRRFGWYNGHEELEELGEHGEDVEDVEGAWFRCCRS